VIAEMKRFSDYGSVGRQLRAAMGHFLFYPVNKI